MRVAVIGSGPSSMAAAWAAIGLGASVDVFGPDTPSPIRGAVVIHEPIPGITLTHPDAFIRQLVVGGHIDDYGRKIYGEVEVDRRGDPFLDGFHTWRVDATYDALWRGVVGDPFTTLHPGMVDNFALERLTGLFDLVINTAPAPQFCVGSHEFVTGSVDLTWELRYPGQLDNTIVYNADPDTAWARSASIFGSMVTEWVQGYAGRVGMTHHKITKPLHTECDCHPEVFRTGRYGAWSNRQWIETAYYGTRRRMLDGQ